MSRYDKRFIVVTTGRGVDLLKIAGVECQSLEIPPEQRAPNLLGYSSDADLEALELPLPIFRALKSAGIHNISALCAKAAGDLLKEPNLGIAKVNAIREALKQVGIALKGEKP